MAEKKITKVEKIDMLLAIDKVAENEMLVEFLTNEKNLIIKKKTYKSTNKKKVADNTELLRKIETVFNDNPNLVMTCSDVSRYLNFEFSTQKLAPRLKELTELNILTASIEKGQKYYKLA